MACLLCPQTIPILAECSLLTGHLPPPVRLSGLLPALRLCPSVPLRPFLSQWGEVRPLARTASRHSAVLAAVDSSWPGSGQTQLILDECSRPPSGLPHAARTTQHQPALPQCTCCPKPPHTPGLGLGLSRPPVHGQTATVTVARRETAHLPLMCPEDTGYFFISPKTYCEAKNKKEKKYDKQTETLKKGSLKNWFIAHLKCGA